MPTASPKASSPSTSGLWPLAGCVAGVVLAAVDYLLLRGFGLAIRLGDADVTLAVMALFAGSYATLGYVIVRLVLARRELQRDAGVIRTHVNELERTRNEAIQNEKLAAIGRLA